MMETKGSWPFRAAASVPALACAFVSALPASAQERAAPEPSAETIQEIVVTATKRSQNIQDVPGSVAAITGEVVRTQRIRDFSDVALRTPGVSFARLTRNQTYVSIRGSILSNDQPGIEPGASVFVDEVPTTGVGDLSPDLYDVQSIEILRGPQGALLGRNVTGGAISVVTRAPTFDADADLELTYGSDNLFSQRGYLNGTLVPNLLAGRLTFTHTTQDGLYDNVFLGNDVGDTDSTGARAQLLFTPGEALSIRLSADLLWDEGDAGVTNMLGAAQPNATGVPSIPLLSFDADESTQISNGSSDRNIQAYTARVDWRTGLGDVTSVTGARLVDSTARHDPGGISIRVFDNIEIEDDELYMEELRLASPGTGRFNYLVGFNYLMSTRSRAEPLVISIAPGTSVASSVPPGTYNSFVSQTVDTETLALFAEASYDFTDKITLLIGGRYTWDDKEGFTFKNPSATFAGPAIQANYQESWAEFTPRASLTFDPTDDILLYVTYGEGFKSGGFDPAGVTVAGLQTPIAPEFSSDYEAGAKTSWFDDRLIFNLNAFSTKYTDLQFRRFVAGVAFTQTLDAEVEGVEVEFAARPAEWLNLGASYAYMDSEVTRGCLQAANGACSPFRLVGKELPRVPKNSLTLHAELDWPVSSLNGRVTLRADWASHSDIWFDLSNAFNPNFADPAVFTLSGDSPEVRDRSSLDGMLNLRASLQSGAWEFAIWGRNVTDERSIVAVNSGTNVFLTSTGNLLAGRNITPVHYNDPAQFGITITRRWGN